MADVSGPDLADMLALDYLTLRNHTEAAGQNFDAREREKSLRQALAKSEVVIVRRQGKLVAYANLWRKQDDVWFVGMFNTHPNHRNAGVMREMMHEVRSVLTQVGARTLQSNVFKTNPLSLAFHRKLGFVVTRENAVGVEMTLHLYADDA